MGGVCAYERYALVGDYYNIINAECPADSKRPFFVRCAFVHKGIQQYHQNISGKIRCGRFWLGCGLVGFVQGLEGFYKENGDKKTDALTRRLPFWFLIN